MAQVCPDAYVRLAAEGRKTWGQPHGDDSLLFVDVEPGQPLADLRNCPPALLHGVGVILVREPHAAIEVNVPPDLLSWSLQGAEGLIARFPGTSSLLPDREQEPSEGLGELAELVERLGLDCQFGVVHQPLGQQPRLSNADIDSRYLDRARALEIEALLRLGEGVWEPGTYHYRLPSGEHAAGFVRTANAVQSPRDAEVIASWLREHARDGLGVVLDTGTLTSVALAFHNAMIQGGLRPGPIAVVASYPTTERDVAEAVERAAIERAVLAVLSVSSSGQILRWLSEAMRAKRLSAVKAIEVLVDKRPINEHHLEDNGIAVSTWHPRPGAEPLVKQGSRAEACKLCKSAASYLVPIRAGIFEGMFEASIVRLTPDLEDPRRNRELWTHCDRLEAIHVHEQAVPAIRAQRATGPMGIRIDHAPLVVDADFRDTVTEALRSRLAKEGVTLRADLVLVREDEYRLEGLEALVEELSFIEGTRETRPFPGPREDWSPDLRQAVSDADNLLVLSLGAVTGLSMQRALIAAQHLRLGKVGNPVRGMVVHSRLPDEAAWRTLRNSFNRHLYASFHGYLPLRSPLDDERSVLDALPGKRRERLSGEAQALFDQRRRFCERPSDEPDLGLFWGSTPSDRLTPLSVLGEGLRSPAVYAAIASSLESSRQEQGDPGTPQQRVFDIPAITRSYYDPLILSAIFRWLQPWETWWGRELLDAEAVVFEMCSRGNQEDDLRILVPELLLAGAQGKVAAPGLAVVRAYGEVLLEHAELSPSQLASIQLGLAVAAGMADDRKTSVRDEVVKQMEGKA